MIAATFDLLLGLALLTIGADLSKTWMVAIGMGVLLLGLHALGKAHDQHGLK